MLGLSTGQGVKERQFRLGEKLHNRRPLRMSHPAVDRARAHPSGGEADQARHEQDVLAKWLASHVAELEQYAQVLIEHKDLTLTDDTYSEVLALRGLTRDPGRGVAWFVQLTDTTILLAADPAVEELPPTHLLRDTLASLDNLATQWAAIRRPVRSDT
jgi:hypothetical protein